MLVLAPAACCLAGLALSEVTSYLATSLAAAHQDDAAAATASAAASRRVESEAAGGGSLGGCGGPWLLGAARLPAQWLGGGAGASSAVPAGGASSPPTAASAHHQADAAALRSAPQRSSGAAMHHKHLCLRIWVSGRLTLWCCPLPSPSDTSNFTLKRCLSVSCFCRQCGPFQHWHFQEDSQGHSSFRQQCQEGRQGCQEEQRCQRRRQLAERHLAAAAQGRRDCGADPGVCWHGVSELCLLRFNGGEG